MSELPISVQIASVFFCIVFRFSIIRSLWLTVLLHSTAQGSILPLRRQVIFQHRTVKHERLNPINSFICLPFANRLNGI